MRRRVAHDSRPWTATRVQLPTLVQIGGSQPTLSAVLATRGVERFAKPATSQGTGLKSTISGPFFIGSLVGVGCRLIVLGLGLGTLTGTLEPRSMCAC